ncbi:MAG: hypothetical protein Q8K85_20375, partial [Hyphomicrobium sp.]|nr:hypothetical protein [Hyphomicrobium sp.]
LYPRVKVGAKVTVTWQTFRGSASPVSASSNDEEAGQARKTYNSAKRRVPKNAEAPKRPMRSAAAQ